MTAASAYKMILMVMRKQKFRQHRWFLGALVSAFLIAVLLHVYFGSCSEQARGNDDRSLGSQDAPGRSPVAPPGPSGVHARPRNVFGPSPRMIRVPVRSPPRDYTETDPFYIFGPVQLRAVAVLNDPFHQHKLEELAKKESQNRRRERRPGAAPGSFFVPPSPLTQNTMGNEVTSGVAMEDWSRNRVYPGRGAFGAAGETAPRASSLRSSELRLRRESVAAAMSRRRHNSFPGADSPRKDPVDSFFMSSSAEW